MVVVGPDNGKPVAVRIDRWRFVGMGPRWKIKRLDLACYLDRIFRVYEPDRGSFAREANPSELPRRACDAGN